MHFLKLLDMNIKDVRMLYHTTLRNVGLFTSVSLATLGYSQYYRSLRNTTYNISFIIISIGYLFIATYINYLLIVNQHKFTHKMQKNKKRYLQGLTSIAEYVLYINCVVIFFTFYTLYRELNDIR